MIDIDTCILRKIIPLSLGSTTYGKKEKRRTEKLSGHSHLDNTNVLLITNALSRTGNEV